ncbi:MAG TPA: hypothetical protein VJB82_01800 [Candidatus Peribacterales bacterium]|nr:hypothetical protein [Candidatus Peribacterales bacterium]
MPLDTQDYIDAIQRELPDHRVAQTFDIENDDKVITINGTPTVAISTCGFHILGSVSPVTRRYLEVLLTPLYEEAQPTRSQFDANKLREDEVLEEVA